MDSLPTIDECSSWILEHCETILSFMDEGNFDIKDIVQTTFDSTRILINAFDTSKKEKAKLLNKLDKYSKFKQNDTTMKLLILNIKEICFQVNQTRAEQEYLGQCSHNFIREKEVIVSSSHTSWKAHYNSIWPDQIDEKAGWFRKYFVGKQYVTFIGPIMDDENDLSVISVVKEYEKESKQKPILQYRIIVRTKQDINMSFIVHESDAKELIVQIEESLVQNKLDVEIDSKRHRPLRSFSSAIITGMSNMQYQQQQQNHSTRTMRAALLFLFQDINFKLFKELSAETTILSGLEKEFIRHDEIGIPKFYKFGVLNIKQGQTTEEEWFSNSGLTIGLEKLLNIIAKPVELKGYKGYAAGLDTKTGESGEISYISSWRDHEIMYHVAPLMPSREHDIQQIHRKRYIGNDIVCIVFMEGKDQTFDPNSIRSQFLHVFIIVHREVVNNQDAWRVEVLHKKNVEPFSPPIPSPSVFYKDEEFRNFLVLKLINAENSSLKSSDRFTDINAKSRQSILKSLIETGLEASQVARSFGSSNNQQGTRFYGGIGGGSGGEKKQQIDRPKSAGAQQQHLSSVRSSFKSNHAESSRSVTPEMPPMPSISRSSVLRDLKSFTRRKSGNGVTNGTKLMHQNHSPNHIGPVRPQNLKQPSPPQQQHQGKQPQQPQQPQQPHQPQQQQPPQQPPQQQQKKHPKSIQSRPSFQRNEIAADEIEDKKKGLEPLDENSVVTGTGIRYKAHNLMNSMIGRRNSRTGLSNSSS